MGTMGRSMLREIFIAFDVCDFNPGSGKRVVLMSVHIRYTSCVLKSVISFEFACSKYLRKFMTKMFEEQGQALFAHMSEKL